MSAFQPCSFLRCAGFCALAFCSFALLTLARGTLPDSKPVMPPPIDFAHLPWADGERLTYLVSWGGLQAAQGTFVASEKEGRWEFKLTLASAGVVNEIYPFTGTFWSILDPAAWRSMEYGEYRFEPSRIIRERTRIDYAEHHASREIWSTGQTRTFPIAEDAVDDVGTMLYHVRSLPWTPGTRRTLFVYENNSEKQADVMAPVRESQAFGIWPKQPLLRLLLLPGKGTHHRGRLMLWMTDDARRLPVHADLDFRYGSFSIDLIKAEKTLPAP